MTEREARPGGSTMTTPRQPPGEVFDQRTISLEGPPPSTEPAAGSSPAGARFGDYLLVSELGRGGMGVVYKAFEPELGRHVALKMVLESAAGPDELQRFHTEAAAAARLQHPSIVKVHRVGVQDGRHYF